MKWTSEMIMDAMNKLGRHVDFYLADKLNGKCEISIEAELSNQNRNIHRLGYYYPPANKNTDIWLGFHCDYTIFTGLCPNVYFDKQGN